VTLILAVHHLVWTSQHFSFEIICAIFCSVLRLRYAPSAWNKINIHVGGTYGDKDATLQRFAKVGVCNYLRMCALLASLLLS
jgi:hypothetical protein